MREFEPLTPANQSCLRELGDGRREKARENSQLRRSRPSPWHQNSNQHSQSEAESLPIPEKIAVFGSQKAETGSICNWLVAMAVRRADVNTTSDIERAKSLSVAHTGHQSGSAMAQTDPVLLVAAVPPCFQSEMKMPRSRVS
jgi:hypothetical protein